jgi:CBS domain-containing protein
MAAVRDILAKKGSLIVALPPSASVLEAARVMSERSVGAVLVIDEGRLAGIFTERDILRRVVAEGRDPAKEPLSNVVTKDVLTCTPATPLDECRALMTTRRLRHLPVVGPDGLCGVISSGDVLAFQVAEQQSEIQDLNRYVYDMR